MIFDMDEHKLPKLRCNSEFRRLCLPMSQQEYENLERELLFCGDTVVIKTWGSAVLYDFEKYEICKKHNIPYTASQVHSRNSVEALLWLCKNQLDKPELPYEMRRYLIGKHYLFEKMLGAHDAAAYRSSNEARGKPRKNEPRYEDCSCRICERLGKEYNIAGGTVWKYGLFAEALDIVYDISEDFAVGIMKGTIKISQENVILISQKNKNEIMDIANSLLIEKATLSSFAGSRKLMGQVLPTDIEEIAVMQSVSIKDMPEYDPDAEAASLTLTIPSWISSMKRVLNASDMTKVSLYAKNRLRNELEKLGNSTFEIIEMLKEQ